MRMTDYKLDKNIQTSLQKSTQNDLTQTYLRKTRQSFTVNSTLNFENIPTLENNQIAK